MRGSISPARPVQDLFDHGNQTERRSDTGVLKGGFLQSTTAGLPQAKCPCSQPAVTPIEATQPLEHQLPVLGSWRSLLRWSLDAPRFQRQG